MFGVFRLVSLFCMMQIGVIDGFMVTTTRRPALVSSSSHYYKKTTLYGRNNDAKLQDSQWLQEFSIATGEVINPYKVLKVSRKATRQQIRESYIALSRRYHPDGVRHRNLLPGSCNNMDDVRDQWERIKLSYEILTNPKLRKKYDRHEAIADPGAAVKRAAVNAAFDGIKGVGKGIFGVGAFAVEQIIKKNTITNNNTKEVGEVRADQ